MGEEYVVVGEFLSSNQSGKEIKMVVVRNSRGACTMPEEEWRRIISEEEKQYNCGNQYSGGRRKNDSAA